MTNVRSWIGAVFLLLVLGAAGCAATGTPAPGGPGVAGASAPAAASPAPDDAGPFTPLFNGKDTTGWVQILDSNWVVEDGVLVAR